MATVPHHVYSSYNPEEDRERLEVETGQLDAQADIADPWLTEKPYGTNKRIQFPPLFVPATIDYNEWSSSTNHPDGIQGRKNNEKREGEESVAGWYRNLARKMSVGSSSSTPGPGIQTPPLAEENAIPPSKKKPSAKDKNNWFISRVLDASSARTSSSSDSGPSSRSDSLAAPPATIADILARDPPPLLGEGKYEPPVWLAIGPGNKGFAMLQKSGWEEGEALGKASRYRAGLGFSRKGKEKVVETADVVKKEVIDLASVNDEVIDLTLDDDDDSDSNFLEVSTTRTSASRPTHNSAPASFSELEPGIDHAPRALLTPLPTVLKSDRLGIGLKAKTSGSGLYREPVKRVTHSQAALAAHIRAAEAQKKMKKTLGKGRRGFEKLNKKEQEGRRNLMSYLNG